jgi:hypothetical protein
MTISLLRKKESDVVLSTYRNMEDGVKFYNYNLDEDGEVIGTLGATHEVLYFGFKDSAITSDKLKEVFIRCGSFFDCEHFYIEVIDNPTLETKLEAISTKLEEGKYKFTTYTVQPNPFIEFNNSHYGHIIYSDYRMNVNDDVLGVVTAFGDVTITIPDITTLSSSMVGNIFWRIYKMTGDENRVKIVLEEPSQSFVKYSMRYLTKIGMGVEVGMYREGTQYWFTDISTQAALDRVNFVNLMPILDNGSLTLRGELIDLTNNDGVICYFRYREEEGTPWIVTDETEETEEGLLETTETVSGTEYQTQMVIRDVNGSEFYSTILAIKEAKPYYASVEAALSDGMLRLWQLQEHTGTDDVGEEIIDDQDMKFTGGSTWGQDTIGSEIIYKRILNTSSAYGEAKLNIKVGRTYTFCLWVDMNTLSGDHTLFSNGKNILSLGADGTNIQLEVNGVIKTWTNCLPFNEFKVLFVTVNPPYDKTVLLDVTSTTVTKVIDFHDTIRSKGIYFRLGRGASGDANHQDYEYMDDGAVRTVGIWDRILSDAQMTDIVTNFESGGLLV